METTTNNVQSTELTTSSKNLAEMVNNRINELAKTGGLDVAPNYSPANAVKFAVLQMQNNPALAKCSAASKANALMSMVVQGLNPIKNQCYFIPYGNDINLQLSCFGKQAMAMRTGKLACPPKAQIIYADDDFGYEVDTTTGYTKITKHHQSLANIDNAKIIGAYAITRFNDGTSEATIMTMAQIEKSWNQGATKGKSPAHQNFREEMAKKTVISRALKNVINSSDDGYLFADDYTENDSIRMTQSSGMQDFEETEAEEILEAPKANTPEAPQEGTSTANSEPF